MPASDTLCANTLRGLAIDAIQAANSGHPGMPLGMADAATVLWTRFLTYDPSCPQWPDRDRFVLSAGHGSMLLYGLLHLSGLLPLEEIRRFRQLGSRTPGHPEVGVLPLVETTTGPLGQGFANAVGMAIAEQFLRERFGPDLCDHRTWVIAGDGDLMEGVCHEAASLAGHLGLGRLVVLYDDNGITIDGSTRLAFSEDGPARFTALGWHVQRVDGHDPEQVAGALDVARSDPRPSLVCCRTVIGWGSPHKASTSAVHGAPLGTEEVRLTKQALGLDPDADFAVPSEVVARFRVSDPDRAQIRRAWEARLASHPRRADWERFHARDLAPLLKAVEWPRFEAGTSVATRVASGKVISALAEALPNLLGGSADLAASNNTLVPGGGNIGPGDFKGRNLHFGIREHAMAAICNGLALHGGLLPYCATFLVFHDYLRGAARLAGLMALPVTHVYTHDSIYVGEDGPTHQPIEQLAALRTLPGWIVLRPSDAAEVVEAWRAALLHRDGPTALVLTRQNLPVLDRETRGEAVLLHRGAYVLEEANGAPRVVVIASGSEVALALEARKRLEAEGIPVRVVAMPSWELFDRQDPDWRRAVLPPGVPRVSVEAGRTLGWERYVGDTGASVGIDRFGLSAPGAQVARALGLTVEAVVEACRRILA
ncbi:MAG: transketolase [Deltaproteobacteria bacterium]|nr:transketolase [Deltaproteobacteria bacterium]